MGPCIKALPEHTAFEDVLFLEIPTHTGVEWVLRSTSTGDWQALRPFIHEGYAVVGVTHFCTFIPVAPDGWAPIEVKAFVPEILHHAKSTTNVLKLLISHGMSCRLCRSVEENEYKFLQEGHFQSVAASFRCDHDADVLTVSVSGEDLQIPLRCKQFPHKREIEFYESQSLEDVNVSVHILSDPCTEQMIRLRRKPCAEEGRLQGELHKCHPNLQLQRARRNRTTTSSSTTTTSSSTSSSTTGSVRVSRWKSRKDPSETSSENSGDSAGAFQA